MTAHSHAEKMMQYAQDAMETTCPWERWLVDDQQCVDHPRWSTRSTYKRKPQTIRVNGVEVPEPVRGMLDYDAVYYIADPADEEYFAQHHWDSDDHDKRFQERGLIHLTEKAAIAHAKAMLKHD